MPTSLLLSSHTHRLLGEQDASNRTTGKQKRYRSFFSRSIPAISVLNHPQNHPLIRPLRRRSSRRQFEPRTTPNASIGLTTPSLSIICKFLSLFYLMRSSNQVNLHSMYLGSVAGILPHGRQPRSAQECNAVHNPIISELPSSNPSLLSFLGL